MVKTKKMWKDRTGFGGITAILAVILVIALACMAYMAMAQLSDSDGNDQSPLDPEDRFIGYINVDVTIKIEVPPYSGAVFTLNDINAELVQGDGSPTQSIFDSLFLSPDTGDKDLKIVIQMDYPAYGQTGLIDATREWNQEFEQPWLSNNIPAQYADQSFNSGGIRYHGSYVIEVSLFKMVDGDWELCETMNETVVI